MAALYASPIRWLLRRDAARALGCKDDLARVAAIVRQGSGADRQRGG